MPPSTRRFRRWVRMLREMPRRAWKSSNRVTPKNASRTMSRLHHSPTTSRHCATEHLRSSKLVRCTESSIEGCVIERIDPRLSSVKRLSPDEASDGTLAEPAAAVDRRREVTWADPLVGAALARDMSGLDYLRGIAEGRIPAAPIAALMGMSLVRAEPGQVTFRLDVGEHLYNPIGSVHGGVFCTLLDSAMGCAVHASLDRGQAYTTLELKVNIVNALTLSTPSVTATGQVISAGRRVITASGQITGPDGTLYAHATTTCLVLDPRSAAGQEVRPAPGLDGREQPPGGNGDGR